MTTNRTALNVMLAALELEQREVAQLMGYDERYVSNVFNGFTSPSAAFKSEFGRVLADLLLGETNGGKSRGLPAKPFTDYIERRAGQAPNIADFYADLGLSRRGWSNRKFVSEELVDRVCCQLGIHISAIYGTDADIEEAS